MHDKSVLAQTTRLLPGEKTFTVTLAFPGRLTEAQPGAHLKVARAVFHQMAGSPRGGPFQAMGLNPHPALPYGTEPLHAEVQ